MFLRPLLCLICMFILVNNADAAPYAYISNAGTGSVDPNAIPPVYDTVSIVDLATGSVSSQNIINPSNPAVAAHPYGVAVTADGKRIYISNQLSKTISVLDGSTSDQAVIGTISRTFRPGGLAVNPAGSRLFVANENDGSVSVLDTTTPSFTEITKISLDLGSTGIAVVPGSPYKVFVTNGGSNTVSVITADDSINSYVKGTDITAGSSPEGIAYNPANSQLYVANLGASTVTVINAGTNAVVKTITLPPNCYPVGVAVNASGSKVYVSKSFTDSVAVIDTTTNELDATLSSIATGVDSGPYGVAVNPENGLLYVAESDPNSVSTTNVLDSYNPADGGAVANYTVGKHPQAFGNFIGPMMYPITVTQPTNGTIAPAGNPDVLVARGFDETFTVTPTCGYSISQVLLDGGTPVAGPPYTVGNVQAAHTLSATINRTQWQVTANNVPNGCTGTVNSNPVATVCGGNNYYNVSTSPVFTAAPNAGCKIDWTGCTSVAGNDCTVTLGDAVGGSDKTVTATFSPLGGPVKALVKGTMDLHVMPVYVSLYTPTESLNDIVSIVADSTGLNDQTEQLDYSQTAYPLVIEMRGGATTIQHDAWNGISTINKLTIGGNGANGTKVEIKQQTINIK
jgi:YVTN family beta-propeller protein